MQMKRRYNSAYLYTMSHTPPVLKIPVSIFFLIGAIPYYAVMILAWLVGFYRCTECEHMRFISTSPKKSVSIPRGQFNITREVVIVCSHCADEYIKDGYSKVVSSHEN